MSTLNRCLTIVWNYWNYEIVAILLKFFFYLLERLIDGETMEIVTDFIFGGSKITADDCSHEIHRCLLLGRKAMTNLDSILKSRDITLTTKICLIKAMVFPVVSSVDMRVDSYKKLSAEELMLLNCGVGKYS